jgi:hypothetical protein
VSEHSMRASEHIRARQPKWPEECHERVKRNIKGTRYPAVPEIVLSHIRGHHFKHVSKPHLNLGIYQLSVKPSGSDAGCLLLPSLGLND